MADIKEVAVEGKQKTMKGNIVEHAVSSSSICHLIIGLKLKIFV